MRVRMLFLSTMLSVLPALCFAKADGSWLKKVPQADRARANPYAGNLDAIAAGRNLFVDNCATVMESRL